MRTPIHKRKVEGYLTIHIIRKGKRIPVCVDRPNLVLNGRLSTVSGLNSWGSGQIFYTFTDASANYQDLDGTWNQSGNTVTRASGSGTFPASPSQIGNELQWQDGERCHVTARASDTSITVSGPPRTLTGKTIRRWLTNRTSLSGSSQSVASGAPDTPVYDHVAGTASCTWRALFSSATSAYTLASVMLDAHARVVLLAPVAVEIDDQLEMSYTLVLSVGNKNFSYDLGDEAVGIPTQYTASTIVGNGTSFDIVTSINNHFLAGDQILLENFVPKRFAIASGSSNSTTITVNTTAAHGLSVSDAVVIEGASVAGYNGTWTVDTVVDADTFTIASALNPGALGASGTVRLATPVTYFNGTFTVASKPAANTIRVTSSIQGPAIDPKTFGSIRAVTYDVWGGASPVGMLGRNAFNAYCRESNPVTVPAPQGLTNPSNPTGSVQASTNTRTNATFNNDWTSSLLMVWNAGTGESRLKQLFAHRSGSASPTPSSDAGYGAILTFAVPQSKTTADRLRWTISMQISRDLVS